VAATTTIRLPPKLRARIQVLARQTGRSAHSVILEAIERQVGHEEELRRLVRDALANEAQLERTKLVYGADDVAAWLERLGAPGATRPAPWPR